jgi:LysM repeat protein
LLVAAFAAVAVARLSGSGGPAQVGAIGSIAPSTAAAATPLSATPAVEPSPAPTPEPTVAPTAEPSPAPTAEPTAAPTAVPSTPPASRTYTVQSGDTLSGIASQFGTSVDAIVELNNLPNRNYLSIGQVLKIP